MRDYDRALKLDAHLYEAYRSRVSLTRTPASASGRHTTLAQSRSTMSYVFLLG
jgi:hypothetical protein